MPRIPGPQDVGQARAPRDTGVRNAGAAGRAFADLGQTVFQVADRLRERRQQAEDVGFMAHISSEANKRFTETFEQRQLEATEGAEEFTGVIDSALSEQQEALINEARTQSGFRPSQNALDKAQLNLSALRGRFGVKAATFENNARVEKMGREVETTLSDIALQAFNDPDNLDAYTGQALGLLEDAEGLIPAGKLAERRESIRGEVTISAVNGLINEDPREALELLKEGKFDKGLDAQAKNQLMDSAGISIRRQQAEERRNEKERLARLQSEVRSGVKDEVAAVQRTGQRAGVVSDTMIAAAFPDTGDQIVRQIREEQEFFNVRQGVALSTPEEDAQVLEGISPEGEGFAAEAQRQDRLKKALIEKYTALGIGTEKPGDPVEYILGTSPELAEALQSDEPEEVQQATSRLLSEQARLGVPAGRQRALSDVQAVNLVSSVETAPTDERAPQMAQLQETFGEHFDRVFGEMVNAGLSAEMTVLASVVDDPLASQQISQLIATPESDLKSGIVSDDLRAIEENVNDDLAEFFQAVEAGDFTGASTSLTAKYRSVVEKLAIQEFRRTGDIKQAVERATSNIILDRYETLFSGSAPDGKGFAAYIPRVLEGQRIEPARVETVADRAQSEDRIKAFDPAPIDAPDSPDFVDRQRIIRTATNSGFWVTNESGTGLVLMLPFVGGGALPLVNEQGERYEIGFVDAMAESERLGDQPIPDPTPRRAGQRTGRQF